MPQTNQIKPTNSEVVFEPLQKSNKLLPIIITVLATAIVVGMAMYFIMTKMASNRQRDLDGEISKLQQKVNQLTNTNTELAVSDNQINCGGDEIFIAKDLGIAFCYPKKFWRGEMVVKQIERKIYVGGLEDQSVEVFSKEKSDNLEEAIKKTFLRDYSKDDCWVDNNKFDYYGQKEDGSIKLPALTCPRIAQGRWFDDDIECNCPVGYTQANGIRYFYTQKDSGKFLFFDIGQYYIELENKKPWQDTIKFLD